MQRRIDFHGRLDGRTELGDGSVRFTARLTRTGVFDYGDHRELRVPEEVFSKNALDSFRGVAVTDGHVAWIDADNWRKHAIGHVGDDVHQDGEFVVASLVIKDKGALEKVDNGELVELSMGYSVDLERTPGKTDSGEEYDAIQRNIVGNHAALGPRDWGRAGSSVRLLDGAAYAPAMPPEKRIDAPPANDLDAARAELEAVRKERDAARADLEDTRKRADKLEAERDTLRQKLDEKEKEEDEDDEEKKKEEDEDEEKKDARVDARVKLILDAKSILGSDFDFRGKSDRAIRIAVLQKVDSKVNFDGKSDDYVAARFDLVTEQVKDERIQLSTLHERAGESAQKKSKLDEAHERAAENARKAAQAGPPEGARTRSK